MSVVASIETTVRGADLRIRQAEPSDHEGLMMTMASPLAYRGTLQLPLPSREHWRQRMAAFDPEAFMLVAEVLDAGSPTPLLELVGHASLHPTGKSPRRRHAMGLGISVRDNWQGRGIGSALLTTLIDRADNWMGLLRIELTVFVDNAAALALYRRHGFALEGTHRAYALRDGVYADAHAMARLHPRPPTLPSTAAE